MRWRSSTIRTSKSSSSTTTRGTKRSGGRSKPSAASWASASASSIWPQWPGFKAGALNFGLRQHRRRCRDHRASSTATIMVTPDWLSVDGALFRAREGRLRPVAAGLSRLERRHASRPCATGNMPGLLQHRHDPAERAQRDHPARHHDPDPQVGADRSRPAGASGASPRTPSSACACSKHGYEAVYMPDSFGQGLDAGQLRRLSRSSASAGPMARCRS